MQFKNFKVSGKWLYKGQQVPLYAKDIQIKHDGENYIIILTPFHADPRLLEFLQNRLFGIFVAEEPVKSFLMEAKTNTLELKITTGKLGVVLQHLIDNNFIDITVGNAALEYHHNLHNTATLMQRFRKLREGYEAVATEPPPSFKLTAKVS